MRWLAIGREIERPVERGIAAADDQDALSAEDFHLAHGIKHRLRLVGLDAGDRRAFGLERAAAGGHHNHLRLENFSLLGAHAKERIADALDGLNHVLQMEGRLERLDLLHQCVGDALAGDIGNAGNVIDRLFGIKFGALPADLVENVDDMRLHVEQAELENREQPARPGADDERVGLNGLAGCRVHVHHYRPW